MPMRQPVKAPAIRPAKHGLIESANLVDGGDSGWKAGIEFTPEVCYVIHGYQVQCPPSPTDKSAGQECQASVGFDPYLLELEVVWSTLDTFDSKSLLLNTIDVGTSAMLEDIIATGPTAGTPGDANFLLSGGTNAGTSADPYEALGKIEAALLSTTTKVGAGGMVHMSPVIAAQVGRALYEYEGCLYTKATGAKVVVGNYPADTIYAHVGEMDVYLDEPFIIDTADGYRTNEKILRVERLALVAWEPCGTYKVTVT